MKKTIFVLLDACQYEAGTRNLGYLEHLIDYKKGAKYKVKGELPSLSRPMYATLLTGTPVFSHGITTNDTLRTLDCDNVFPSVRNRVEKPQPPLITGSENFITTFHFALTAKEYSFSLPKPLIPEFTTGMTLTRIPIFLLMANFSGRIRTRISS